MFYPDPSPTRPVPQPVNVFSNLHQHQQQQAPPNTMMLKIIIGTEHTPYTSPTATDRRHRRRPTSWSVTQQNQHAGSERLWWLLPGVLQTSLY